MLLVDVATLPPQKNCSLSDVITVRDGFQCMAGVPQEEPAPPTNDSGQS
jgi:hypothetical protein